MFALDIYLQCVCMISFGVMPCCSSIGAPLKGVTPQRPSFMGSNKKHSSHQPLQHATGRDIFAPPFKKSENTFSTPYKPDMQTSFKTPMKSSGGPDQLRKRLAFAEKSNAHPEKKLKLDDGVRVKCTKNHQNEQSEGSVNEIKTAHSSETVGKNSGFRTSTESCERKCQFGTGYFSSECITSATGSGSQGPAGADR